ncbi:MAG: serine hydroxymethyltransferase [Patescibacteria group bacterium]|nr:serine hydroxymethyltransferase [Patescibacteria group bacterium]
MHDKITIKQLIKKELKRQNNTINLIASENYVSKDVLKALGSALTNKYSEGYPGKRYYGGNEIIDQVEEMARELARRAFHLGKQWHVNVQPYSGSPANMAVYYALLNPGEKIMGMSLPFGGHLTHGWKVSFSARFYKSVQYPVGRNGLINYSEVQKLAKKEKPKIIIAGATAYSRFFDFKKFAAIAHNVGAYLMVDMAHIAGLVAARVHSSPFPYADVVTTTTHKTLRGPRGAIIFANRNSKIAEHHKTDIATSIDKAVFPALQGGPHDNQTAAIAVCLSETLEPSFKKYARQIVKNARALAAALKKHNFQLVSDGTDNHLMLLDLTNFDIPGKDAQEQLEKVGIVVNRNTVPYDRRSPFNPSGIRIGTPAITTRGMKEKEMKIIAELISQTLLKETSATATKKEILRLCRKFPLSY